MNSIKLVIEKNKPLKPFNTFGIGGNAAYYTAIHTEEEAYLALKWAQARNIAFFVLGNGSNILFDEEGYSGLIIHNKMNALFQNGNHFLIQSGVLLPKIAHITLKQDLKGFEWGIGIPATIGGALFMNASCHGGAISDTLVSCEYLTLEGKKEKFLKKDLFWGYRKSSFHDKTGIILNAEFVLSLDPLAKDRSKEYLVKRQMSQPLKDKSAGCVFRNPLDASAGRLIDQCGLKGYKIGGAEISTLHANFIVNMNHATSQDVMNLIQHIKKIVLEKTGILLEEEIGYVPYRKN
jgi:UDP-N-acetylmuramate dehydrogenase